MRKRKEITITLYVLSLSASFEILFKQEMKVHLKQIILLYA